MSKIIDSVKIGIASPEKIISWSSGEVTKFGTKSYKSLDPEPGTIYGEEIFGPTKDYTCRCGTKHPETMYRGTKCKKCGVEYTKSSVRRERMGHIMLASPVVHHYYKDTIKLLLDLKVKGDKNIIDSICYCNKYVVINPGNTNHTYKEIISNEELNLCDPEGYSNECYLSGYSKEKNGDNFIALTGALALQILLKEFDLEAEKKKLTAKAKKSKKDDDSSKKLSTADSKRLSLIESFINSGNKPEWMVLTVLPVIPPDVRPLVSLQHGHMSSSDLNDLYNDIISWNDNVKEARTKFFLLNNYITNIRCLQQSVDRLINNENLGQLTSKAASGQPHKSLTGHLSHKKGRFRHDLLGVRVDYSGRSSIAVSPTLKLYQCGVPNEMALTLFRPFLVRRLVVNGIYDDENKAEVAIENKNNDIWDSLQEVMKEHPVLLNRQPSLHRLSIQAFRPVLVEGSAIRLHPLVCPGFNADFDGDTMAIHVVIGDKAIAEAEVLMLASNNVLSPKDGKPIITPGQDMVLGNYYINMEETKDEFYARSKKLKELGNLEESKIWKQYGDNEGTLYASFEEAYKAYQSKKIHLHTRIAVLAKNIGKEFTEEQNKCYLVTTVGKLIFNRIFPSDFPYLDYVKKTEVHIGERFYKSGTNIKEVIEKLPIAPEFDKKALSTTINEVFLHYKGNNGKIAEILDGIKDLGFEYSTVAGMTIAFSDMELYTKKPEMKAEGERRVAEIEELYDRGLLSNKDFKDQKKKIWESIQNDIKEDVLAPLDRKNPINMSADSGARGSKDNIVQLLGMRGYINSLTNKGENLILSSFIEGLNSNEYIIATHGQRKSLSDTALKTQDTGYFSRRMVYAAQNVTISDDDCGTRQGYYIESVFKDKDIVGAKKFDKDNIIEGLYDRIVGRYSKQDVVNPKTGELIVASDEFIDENIAKKIVDAGIKGISIRNVFTCRSKNGICKKCYGTNLSTGLIVEKGTAVGIIAAQSISEPSTQLTMRTFHTGGAAQAGGDITDGFPRVKSLFDPQKNSKNVKYARIALVDGAISNIDKVKNTITISNENVDRVHKLGDVKLLPKIKKGTHVSAGDKLSEGNIDPRELLECGEKKVQDYILAEVQKVYKGNGVDVNDKHIEVIVRQMLRKAEIVDSGDSKLSVGTRETIARITEENNKLLIAGKKPVQFKQVLLSITQSGTDSESFLASAAFQNTSKNLTNASIQGKVDHLNGVMENVICNNLVPIINGSKYQDKSSEEIEAKANEIREKRNEQAKIVEERRKEQESLNSVVE